MCKSQSVLEKGFCCFFLYMSTMSMSEEISEDENDPEVTVNPKKIDMYKIDLSNVELPTTGVCCQVFSNLESDLLDFLLFLELGFLPRIRIARLRL